MSDKYGSPSSPQKFESRESAKPGYYDSPEKATSSEKKSKHNSNPFGKPIEIIKDKLYWVADAKPPQNIENAFFFNIDNDLTYAPFNKDFGPLNLSMVHRYCRELAKLLNGNQFAGPTKIYHYTCCTSPTKMTNACFLMCAFMVVILKLDAEHSYTLFRHYQPKLLHFRDASKGECYYELTILHCLQGL